MKTNSAASPLDQGLEEALARSEQRLCSLLDHCADIVALANQHRIFQYISPAAKPLQGYELDTCIDQSHPEERERVDYRLAALHSKAESRFTTTTPNGNATILLVEDEASLRTLFVRVLNGRGYQVLEAEDGPAALQIAATYPGTISLLLTDVMIPSGLSVRRLVDQISAQRPAIKVLYMSGYAEAMLTSTQISPGQAFLQKPFTPSTLLSKVAELMR